MEGTAGLMLRGDWVTNSAASSGEMEASIRVGNRDSG